MITRSSGRAVVSARPKLSSLLMGSKSLSRGSMQDTSSWERSSLCNLSISNWNASKLCCSDRFSDHRRNSASNCGRKQNRTEQYQSKLVTEGNEITVILLSIPWTLSRCDHFRAQNSQFYSSTLLFNTSTDIQPRSKWNGRGDAPSAHCTFHSTSQFSFFRLVHNISHTLFSRYYFPLNTFLFLYCSLISLCEAVKIFRDPRRWRSYERSGTATTTAKRNYLSSENFLPIRYCDLAWLDLECKKRQFG